MLTSGKKVSTGNKGRWVVVPSILTALMLFVSLASALESNIVAIEDVAVAPGGVVVVPIVIEHATGIGGVGIKLSYDPSVVTVTDATAGDFTAFFGFDTTNAANGWIAINTFVMGQDLTGNVKVAEVTLVPVGNAGDSSVLDLSILAMADQYGTDVNGTTDNGVFVISSSSNAGGGSTNGGITTPYPTATPTTTPTSPSPTSSSTNPPQPSASSGSGSTPVPSMNSLTPPTPVPTSIPSAHLNTPAPSTPGVTSNPSTPMNTPTPRTPGFEAIPGIAVILAVRTWFTRRRRGKFK